MSIKYWHAELGADGKDYRADFVHTPFPEILTSRVPGVSRPAAQVSALGSRALGPTNSRTPASFYQEIRLCPFIRLFVRGSQ
jgi:hypothetical protein